MVTLGIPQLGTGIQAQVFDGRTAQAQPVRLNLNMASLSGRVSLEICDSYDGTVLSSNAIQEYQILSPTAFADRDPEAELWLSLKRAHIVVTAKEDRRAIMRWFNRFCPNHARRKSRNFVPIFLATLVSGAFSLGCSALAGALGPVMTYALSLQNWSHSMLGRNFMIQDWPACQSSDAVQHIERFLAHVDQLNQWNQAEDKGAPIGVVVFHDPAVQWLTSVRQGDTIAVNLAQVGHVENGAELAAALVLADQEARVRHRPESSVDLILQHQVAQVQGLEMVGSPLSALTATLFASYLARERAGGFDRGAVRMLDGMGIRGEGLASWVQRAQLQDQGLASRIRLPFYFTPNIDPAGRRASIRAALATSAFIPETGNQGLDLDALKTSSLEC